MTDILANTFKDWIIGELPSSIRRTIIETGFHMIKINYGDSLLTKNYNANVNEIKVKFLCHNICVLIQEAFENNVEIDFKACSETINPVQIKA